MNEEGQGVFASVVSKANLDAQTLNRSLTRALVRLPTVTPAPPEPELSQGAIKVLLKAQELQKARGDTYISQDQLILALLADPGVASAVKDAGGDESKVKAAIDGIRAGKGPVNSANAEDGLCVSRSAARLTCLAAKRSRSTPST